MKDELTAGITPRLRDECSAFDIRAAYADYNRLRAETKPNTWPRTLGVRRILLVLRSCRVMEIQR